MRLGGIRNLVAHAGHESEFPAVFEFGVKLTFKTHQNVSLAAPVVRQIARGIFDHANPDVPEVDGSPICRARLARVFRRFDARPIRDHERNASYLHKNSWKEGKKHSRSGNQLRKPIEQRPSWNSVILNLGRAARVPWQDA